MKIKSINFVKRMFQRGNVCVSGLRGKGKDMLTANVVVRRKKPYVSNIDYGGDYSPLSFDNIDCGGNTYTDFISGQVKPYVYPYPHGADVYISDGGIYLPSQYCNELNKKYPSLATFQALSRQIADINVHFNTQNLNRMWDKVREQSDIYIRCISCKVVFGLVFQLITTYDKYQSAVDRVQPCRVRVPLFNPQARMTAKTYIDNFYNTHGEVKRYLLIYRNKSSYDTYHFRKLMKGDNYNENEK